MSKNIQKYRFDVNFKYIKCSNCNRIFVQVLSELICPICYNEYNKEHYNQCIQEFNQKLEKKKLFNTLLKVNKNE